MILSRTCARTCIKSQPISQVAKEMLQNKWVSRIDAYYVALKPNPQKCQKIEELEEVGTL